jgi:hypothetical protein
MTTISFDTLAYAKKLLSAGFTQQQAEVQAEALKDIIDDRLATKDDIKETNLQIRESEKNLRHEMKEMELRIVIRLGAMIAASIAIIVTFLKLVH